MTVLSRSPYGYANGDPVNKTDPSGLLVGGVCVSGGVGVGAGVGTFGSLTVCIVYDGTNYAVTYTVATGLIGGGIGWSGTVGLFFSTAETIDDLAGTSFCFSAVGGAGFWGAAAQTCQDGKNGSVFVGVGAGHGVSGTWGPAYTVVDSLKSCAKPGPNVGGSDPGGYTAPGGPGPGGFYPGGQPT